MPRFPAYGFPSQYYRPYSRNNFYNNYKPRTPAPEPTPISNFAPEESSKSDRFLSQKQKSNENVWLDLFGIKLYFDDVLILSLLFFLYKEEVKDEGLFLALVLLLIS